MIGRELRPGARGEGEGASRAGSERAGRIAAAVSSQQIARVRWIIVESYDCVEMPAASGSVIAFSTYLRD